MCTPPPPLTAFLPLAVFQQFFLKLKLKSERFHWCFSLFPSDQVCDRCTNAPRQMKCAVFFLGTVLSSTLCGAPTAAAIVGYSKACKCPGPLWFRPSQPGAEGEWNGDCDFRNRNFRPPQAFLDYVAERPRQVYPPFLFNFVSSQPNLERTFLITVSARSRLGPPHPELERDHTPLGHRTPLSLISTQTGVLTPTFDTRLEVVTGSRTPVFSVPCPA